MKGTSFLIAVLLGTIFAQDAAENLSRVEFQVRVEKEVEADIAEVTLSLNREASTLSKAAAECDKAVAAVKNALKKAGVDTGAVRTRVFSSLPKHGFFSGKVKSYRVEGKVEARITGVKRLPEILSSLNGVDRELVIENVSFECLSEDGIRGAMVREAARKAEALKTDYEAGFKIKLSLFRIQDFGDLVPMGRMARMARPEMMMAVQDGGEESFAAALPVLKYEMRLQAVYRIER